MCVCVCVCVCVRGVVFGGENGSCQRVARATGKLPPSLSFLPWTESSTHDSGGDCGRKALTQRNATLSDGGHPTITQHIFTAY